MTEPHSVKHPSLIVSEATRKTGGLRSQTIGLFARKIMIDLYRITGLPLLAKDGVYRIIIRADGWRHATALVSGPVTVLYETNGMPVGGRMDL